MRRLHGPPCTLLVVGPLYVIPMWFGVFWSPLSTVCLDFLVKRCVVLNAKSLGIFLPSFVVEDTDDDGGREAAFTDRNGKLDANLYQRQRLLFKRFWQSSEEGNRDYLRGNKKRVTNGAPLGF